MIYAKVAALLLVVCSLFGLGFYLASLKYGVEILRLQSAADQAQLMADDLARQKEAIYAANLNKAYTARQDELAQIPQRAITRAVWVCNAPNQIRPGTVPEARPTGSKDSSTGGVQPGSGGRNIRPGLEALKVRYETVIADFRLFHSTCLKQ
jgi:hypothetical protein